MRTRSHSAAAVADVTSLPHPKSVPLESKISAAFDCAGRSAQPGQRSPGSASTWPNVSFSGSKKTTNATKMLPKMGLKALGHKGSKIGSIWDGYQNATSGTFRHEKRRFFMLFTRFSQDIFACKRCDTELVWSEKPPKASGYGRISRKMLPILKLVAKI